MYLTISLVAPLLALQFAVSEPVASCTDRVYAGNENGRFIVSEDGGQTWTERQPVPVPTTLDLFIYSIWAVDNNVYVGTGSGISISRDGGQTWALQDISGGGKYPHVNAVFAIDNRVWAGVFVHRLRVSNDGGETWPVNSVMPLRFGAIEGIYAVDNRTFVGTNNGLGITDDYGSTWRYVNETADTGTSEINAVAGNGDMVYVGMNEHYGTMSISEDRGETWRAQNTTDSGYEDYVFSISTTDTKVYAAVFGAGVIISEDNGKSWAVKGTRDGLSTTDVTRISAVGNNVYVGAYYGISVSRDGGQTFATATTDLPNVSAVFAHCV